MLLSTNTHSHSGHHYCGRRVSCGAGRGGRPPSHDRHRLSVLRGLLRSVLPWVSCVCAPAACTRRTHWRVVQPPDTHAHPCYHHCTAPYAVRYSFGTMRARVIPDEVKSTVIALYRVPLNLFVVAVLLNVDRLGDTVALRLCAGALAVSLVLQSVVATALAAKEKAK